MSRTALTALALLVAGTSSAALAESDDDIRFEVHDRSSDHVQLRIRRDDWGPDYRGSWNQWIAFADLKGMSLASLDKDGPVGFAYVRPAGRFDCKGTAHGGEADGHCTFTANDAFSKYLADRNIEKPTRNQSFGLAMSGVDSDVIDALIKEGMGTPTADQLIGLGVFKVTPEFIREMAHVGGMKVATRDLVQFKIFKVTPESVKAFSALGYRDLTARDLVQFSIFKITPDYIRELASLGYKDVSTQTLVQMHMFGVTPDYIRSVQARSDEKPSPEALVKRRLTGMMPQHSWARSWRRNWRWPSDGERRD